MNNVNFIGGSYKVVTVVFLDNKNKEYVFKVDSDLADTIKSGELLVVHSSNGYGLVRARKVLELDNDTIDQYTTATAWVVNKVDTTRHQKKIDATAKRNLILKQLEEAAQAEEVLSGYRAMAATNPTVGKLLKQLEEVNTIVDEIAVRKASEDAQLVM